MAENSRDRVTITLGQSGQVVKRTATVPEADYSDYPPNAGSKRSIKDRLGSNFDGSLLHESQAHNKRQRGDSYVDVNGMKDICFGKDDLRFKLMRKNVCRKAQSDDHGKSVDLREKLSRKMQPPVPPCSSLDMQQRMPRQKETFRSCPDIWQRMLEPKDTIFRQISPTRSADDLPMMRSSRNSYSPWMLDHIRQRSPVQITGASRGISPPRNVEARKQRPLSRTFEDVRIPSYVNRDVLNAPRSVSSSTAFMTKSVLPTAPSKPAAPLPVQLPPPGGVPQRSLFMVDMAALKQMGENDFKELGVPMGPRKKILRALVALNHLERCTLKADTS
uniref:SAM domain-containing protein n=1 Tax=Rhizophora mucronata TaxID=61149 RepID=A0A2P2JS54_RHIMU